MRLFIYIVTFISINANAQSDAEDIRLKLQNINNLPYLCEGSFQTGKLGCGDSLFWEVVTLKESAIVNLITLLNDTSQTQVYFPNYGGSMTVADVAQIALGEIIQPLPNPNDFFIIEEMNGSQWMANINWLQLSLENRIAYRKSLENWYEKNEGNLVFTLSNTFMCGDFKGVHPNKGHYELRIEK